MSTERETPDSASLDSVLSRTRRAGLALLAGLFGLFALVAVLESRGSVVRPGAARARLQTLRVVLFAASAASALGARILHARMIRPGRPGGAEAGLVRLRRGALTAMAVSTAPAGIGFALFIAAGLSRDFYALAFASLVLLFLYFPRRSAWETILEDGTTPCRFGGRP